MRAIPKRLKNLLQFLLIWYVCAGAVYVTQQITLWGRVTHDPDSAMVSLVLTGYAIVMTMLFRRDRAVAR